MKSKTKQGYVWGGLLILIGLMSLVDTFFDLGPWIWVAALTAAGLGVYGIYAIDRSEKWMLIISYVLLVVSLMVFLINLNVLRDTAIATYVLAAIALPFLIAFLQNRLNWYFLIPAYTLFAVGLMVGMIGLGVLNDLLIPAYVMFAVAIPFLVVYARDSKKWWSLIPGGITAVIGLSFLIAESAVQFIVPAVLIAAGIWILTRQITKKEKPAIVQSIAGEDGEQAENK